MVTAPLMLNGINLELPKTKENNQVSTQSSMVILSLSKELKLYIGEKQVPFDLLKKEVSRALLEKKQEDTVFLIQVSSTEVLLV